MRLTENNFGAGLRNKKMLIANGLLTAETTLPLVNNSYPG